jgi:O-antigen ligase
MRRRPIGSYSSVTRSLRDAKPAPHAASASLVERTPIAFADSPPPPSRQSFAGISKTNSATLLKRGHSLPYAALFLFTAVLYARPSDWYASPVVASLALIIALVTLVLFVPSQLSLEGNLTALPTEIKLVLIFCLTALLSIPMAIDPGQAWQEFSGTFIRCIVIFVVMVNVVRTPARLKGLMMLAITTGVWLSFGAINDYRHGLMTVEGYRVAGRGGGIFGNSNDMALFLVTLVPITVALLIQTKNMLLKGLGLVSTMLMVLATVLTYSRGAFIGLVIGMGFMLWKISPQRRWQVLLVGAVLVAGILVLAPGGYGRRLASIVVPSLDPVGSSDARRGELMRSLYVAIRHPLLGIGMGNYQSNMSYHGLVTHNAYTQVAAEMGAIALICYTMFIVAPFRKLGQIVRETLGPSMRTNAYYLAVGLQASLLVYLGASFFASVAYLWYVYYLVAYAVCLRRIYESDTGQPVVIEKKRDREKRAIVDPQTQVVTA